MTDTLTRLGISYKYEEPLVSKTDPRDFSLPDFTVQYEGETWYWEHLGMLGVPSYSQVWERKRQWCKAQALADRVVTSADGQDGSIDDTEIERTARSATLGS